MWSTTVFVTLFNLCSLINIPVEVALCKMHKVCLETSKSAFENYYNYIGNPAKYIKKPAKIEMKNLVKSVFVSYCIYIRNLEKKTTKELQRKQVLSAIHNDYSGSLHTFC